MWLVIHEYIYNARDLHIENRKMQWTEVIYMNRKKYHAPDVNCQFEYS